jgi:hypothetical protein
MKQLDPNADPSAVAHRMLVALEETAEKTRLIERYAFWTRIWSFVMVGLLLAVVLAVGDVQRSVWDVEKAIAPNAATHKAAGAIASDGLR